MFCPFLARGKNVTHCKLYLLNNTRRDWISEADFVFEMLWQLVGDRLTAHLLLDGRAGPVLQDPFCRAPRHLSLLWDCVCLRQFIFEFGFDGCTRQLANRLKTCEVLS